MCLIYIIISQSSKQLMKLWIIKLKQSPTTKVNDAKSICQQSTERLKRVIQNFCVQELSCEAV